MTAAAPSENPPRLGVVDLARGLALAAMIVYHAAWDLSLAGLMETPVTDYLGWRLFARSIAASFLVLVGVSLALAARRGIDRRAFLRRLGLIGGAAALVTIGTLFALPDRFVFFGILHHIALASVLALPFLRLPTALVLLAAAVALAAPFLVASAAFDAAWLLPLGLFVTPPDTVDFVPVLPWFAAVLVGIVLGRTLDSPALHGLAAWRPSNRATRLLARAGRWSLAVYLLHQPVLLALLLSLAWAIGPIDRPIGVQGFMQDCERECLSNGSDASNCRRLCRCVVERLNDRDFRASLPTGQFTAADRPRLLEVVAVCNRTP